MTILLEKRFHGFQTSLELACIEVYGSDAEVFLQGQTTNCVKTLPNNFAQYNCMLNRQGRIEVFFVLTKISSNHFKLWIPANELLSTAKRLESYIIADDVELKNIQPTSYHLIGQSGLKSPLENSLPYLFLMEPVWLIEKLPSNYAATPQLLKQEIKELFLSRGFYSIITPANTTQLLNETIANEIAWNHDKGCFLGQEVVQKIFTRRGAASYPFALRIKKAVTISEEAEITLGDKKLSNLGVLERDDSKMIFTLLPREYQLEGLTLELTVLGKNISAQVEKINIKQSLADEIYHRAIEYYSLESKDQEAVELLNKLISQSVYFKADSNTLAEWHEALGAIYGKMGKYVEAMDHMHKVAELLPDEVMPYTNLSLYAMKLGKIEEAEKFKEEATVKSFFKLGSEAKKVKVENEKILTREKMFKDVLEIDEYDAMALCGLAEIHLSRKESQAALDRIKKLHTIDEKYSQSYILMGLAQESMGDIDDAKNTWKKGLSVALSKGELMPAQQMQAYLQKYLSQ